MARRSGHVIPVFIGIRARVAGSSRAPIGIDVYGARSRDTAYCSVGLCARRPTHILESPTTTIMVVIVVAIGNATNRMVIIIITIIVIVIVIIVGGIRPRRRWHLLHQQQLRQPQ